MAYLLANEPQPAMTSPSTVSTGECGDVEEAHVHVSEDDVLGYRDRDPESRR